MTKYTDNEKELFQKAISSYKSGDKESAISIMKKLIKINPDSGSYYGYLGAIYFDQKRYHLSRNFFKKSTEINPQSEAATLGYFHSSWSLGSIKAALEEIDRYSSQFYLKDYDQIVQKLKSDQESYKKFQKILTKIQEKINKLKEHQADEIIKLVRKNQ